MSTKEQVIAVLLALAFFGMLALSGTGDHEVSQAEQCYARTHSQSCGK